MSEWGVHISVIGIAQSFLRAHGHGCASVAEDQSTDLC